jgi:hypothetical protein
MSESSPADLAVSFRSLPRRLREAQGDTPADVTAADQRALHATLSLAAAVMHTPIEPLAIADAVDARPADSWTESELRILREAALDAGRHLRAIAAAAPETGGD